MQDDATRIRSSDPDTNDELLARIEELEEGREKMQRALADINGRLLNEQKKVGKLMGRVSSLESQIVAMDGADVDLSPAERWWCFPEATNVLGDPKAGQSDVSSNTWRALKVVECWTDWCYEADTMDTPGAEYGWLSISNHDLGMRIAAACGKSKPLPNQTVYRVMDKVEEITNGAISSTTLHKRVSKTKMSDVRALVADNRPIYIDPTELPMERDEDE